MKSNFDHREFEEYVKNNADQYRMIPSEKVWKGINNILHTRRKWYAAGLTILLLLTAISVTWVMVSYPVSKKQEPVLVSTNAGISTATPEAGKASAESAAESIPGLLSANTFPKSNPPAAPTGEFSNLSQVNDLLSGENRSGDDILSVTIDATPRVATVKNNRDAGGSPVNTGRIQPGSFEIASNNAIPSESIIGAPRSRKQNTYYSETYYPLSIESVVNTYKAPKIAKKISWQLFFTPTVSYRKLRENKSFRSSSYYNPDINSYPFASSGDINRFVTHKPDMGLELGFTAKYPLAKNVRLTGGLQFNINRYDIKAVYTYGEQATITLNGGDGNNSVTAWTNYRNYNGYKSDWLKNLYFSVSAPVGAELRLFGKDKTNFGIAGTIQPTYIIGDRAYLISSDYKNYAEVPDLIRHLNVNTSIETFISYKGRNTRWQIGPQVRYQVLSSFKNKYPIKENLFDYGVKIGISLNH